MKSGTLVLVRTYSAGVHFGTLLERNGKEVTLSDARRIWSWSGANTLHEIAISGVTGRISQSVELIELTEAIEILMMTPEAHQKLCKQSWK